MLVMMMFVVMIFVMVLMMLMTMAMASAVVVFGFLVMMMFAIFHNSTFFPLIHRNPYHGAFRGQKWEILCATQLQTRPDIIFATRLHYRRFPFLPRNCLILVLFSGLSAKKKRCWSCRSCLLFATCTFLPV